VVANSEAVARRADETSEIESMSPPSRVGAGEAADAHDPSPVSEQRVDSQILPRRDGEPDPRPRAGTDLRDAAGGSAYIASAQLVPASRRTVIMKLFFMDACMAKQIAPKAIAEATVPTTRLVRAAGTFSMLPRMAFAGSTVA